MALVCAPSLVQAQSYEFVPINRGAQITQGLDEVAVYAAPVRDPNLRGNARFAVMTVAGGARGSSQPTTTVWEINAASAAAPIVPTRVSVQPGTDTVGLEAAPEGTPQPLVQLIGTADPPRVRMLGLGADGVVEAPLMGAMLPPSVIAELACQRTSPTCAFVYGSGRQLRTTRVLLPPPSNISEFVTSFTAPVENQWDITFDNNSGVIAANDSTTLETRVLRLAPLIRSAPPMLPVESRASRRVAPRIAAARVPHENFTLTIGQTDQQLTATLRSDVGMVPLPSIYVGTAMVNPLVPLAYDVAAGPNGFRVAYFVRSMNQLHLRVAQLTVDGILDPPLDIIVGTTEIPRNVRIAAAFDEGYSLVTWVQGDRGGSENRGYVFRPVAPMMGSDGNGGDASDATVDERGVIPVPEDAIETDVPNAVTPQDATASLDASDGGSSSPQPPIGARYSGGACQCAIAAHSTSKNTGIWLAFALCTVASHAARRRRSR